MCWFRGPAPNIDVHHLPNQRFVVKVVVANSVHSQNYSNSRILVLPNHHWQICVVGHEGVQISQTSRLAAEIFALCI